MIVDKDAEALGGGDSMEGEGGQGGRGIFAAERVGELRGHESRIFCAEWDTAGASSSIPLPSFSHSHFVIPPSIAPLSPSRSLCQPSVHLTACLLPGRLLATCSEDNTVRIWDVAARKEIRTLRFDSLPPASDSLSLSLICPRPSPSPSPPPSPPTSPSPLRGHTDAVYGASWSPDGTSLLSSGSDGNIILWDPHTGEQKATLTPGGDVFAAAFAGDGTIISSSDDKITLWDVATGMPKQCGAPDAPPPRPNPPPWGPVLRHPA